MIIIKYKANSVAFSPQANYTTGRQILVPTFADWGLSHGHRGGSPGPLISVF
jgi:hypothetical protein